MKKLTLIVAISLLGCNNGSSIATTPNTGGSTKVASGGSTGTASGGSTGTTSGGATGTSSGGTTGTSSGGTTGSSTGGSTVAATGGSTVGSTGGSTVVATGGSTVKATGGTTGVATGGSTGTAMGGTTSISGTGGSGGVGGPDAGPDASPPDTRKADTGSTGGAVGTGGVASTGGSVGTGGATGTGGSTTACVPSATGGPSGMNNGQACLTCHAQGKSAYSRAAMTLAGTVYSKATGGTGVSGATVTITPASGSPIKTVTGSSGNFYVNTAITYPATVQISKCPDTVTMPTTISSGDCNSCHGSSSAVLHIP